MASKSIDWDEVLVTKKPKQKEIEVSFKKVDGDGFLGFGDEPGTPGGAVEDPLGCVNKISIVSNDEWNLNSGQPHWVWLTFRSIPTEEYTVTITFSDATLLYASGHYNTQTLDVHITPGSWESNAEGVTGIKVPLTLGDVTDLTDANIESASYIATITAVDGLDVDCWGGVASINFGPDPVENPPEDEAAGGDPVPPEEPPVECQSGYDCGSRYNLSETTGISYDSLYFMREGYPEVTNKSSIVYFSYATDVESTGRGSNTFELRDENAVKIYDGNATSTMPSLTGTPSTMDLFTGFVPDNPAINYTQPESPTNGRNGTADPNYDNATLYERFRYPAGTTGCDGSNYYTATTYISGTAFKPLLPRRNDTVGSVWPETTEVVDFNNVPNSAKWVSTAIGTLGAEQSYTTWTSAFVGRAHNGLVPVTDTIPTTNATYPVFDINVTPAQWVMISDGAFDPSTPTTPGYGGSTTVYVDYYNKEFRYSGYNGNGGANVFVSPYQYPTDIPLEGWYTCKYESYISAARKLTNESGDYGVYDNGVTFLAQRWCTWFLNGRQITPRYLCSNFTRPQDGSYDEFVDPIAQKGVANYTDWNTYFREGMPLEFSSSVLATFTTKPLSVSSRFQPGFDVNSSIQYLNNFCNNTYITRTNAQRDYPLIAYVDHTDSGAGFFKTDQFKRVIRTFENLNPDYCNRIP